SPTSPTPRGSAATCCSPSKRATPGSRSPDRATRPTAPTCHPARSRADPAATVQRPATRDVATASERAAGLMTGMAATGAALHAGGAPVVGVRRVALVGLPGSGKSAVGVALARRLGWRHVDTDALVERGAGMTVAEVFAAEGES